MGVLSIGVIGAGKGGIALIETMEDFNNIRIEGIADIKPSAPGLKLAAQKGIKCFNDPRLMIKECDLDVVFEVTGDRELVKQLEAEISDLTALVDARTTDIMLTVIRDREELLKIKEVKEQLSIILNTAQEGIQMVDKNGVVNYVNEGFTRITGVPAEERIVKCL